MTGTPINLNKARKERARQRARQQADENSVKFGQTRAEKDLAAKRGHLDRNHLDAHRIDPDEDKG